MSAVFVDTGFWIALLNRKDQNHSEAKRLSAALTGSKVVLHELIVYETATFLNASVKSHRLALLFLEFIESQRNFHVVQLSDELRAAALGIFKSHADKDLSLPDCVSFALMRSLRLKNALTFDGHFSQMGFVTL